MIEAFKVFDRDCGGDITSTELRECMTELGHKMSHQEVDEMVRMMDMYSGMGDLNHREGCFDYEEFVTLMTQHCTGGVALREQLQVP